MKTKAVVIANQSKRKQKAPRSQDAVLADQRLIRATMDNSSSQEVIVTRKLTSIGVISTGAGGYITASQINSDGARSTNGFSSFSSRYLQFRVRAISVTWIPLVDSTTALTVGGGAVTPHPAGIFFAKYQEGLGYGSASAIADGQERVLFNGRETFIKYSVDWTLVPEAKLWSATNAAIPTAQQFGIQYQDFGNGPASAATTVYFRSVTEYLVEFQIST